MSSDLTIAWLAQGKIRLKQGSDPARTVESRFGQTIRERALKAQQRHSWKTQGNEDKFLAGAMLWGRSPRDPAAIRLSITSLCPGTRPGQVLYSLETDDLCGILQLEEFGADERRLWNKNDKRIDHLHLSERGELACSIRHTFGTANIAVRISEETGFGEVTEGDSLDTAPHWIPGSPGQLVFQSAGVGRDRDGHFSGIGPYSIQKLELGSGEITCLREDSRYDFLNPRMTADGTLYFIRRPHRTGRDVHPLRLLKDILLFPFRLVYAVFHYLQFFSMRYTGKKLTSGGAQSRELDQQQMMIWGNLVAAQQGRNKGEEAPDLVPSTWELVRSVPNQNEEVIAKGVLAFDLGSDGSLLFSNGSAIFHQNSQGRKERIIVENLIEKVIVLSPVASQTPPAS